MSKLLGEKVLGGETEYNGKIVEGSQIIWREKEGSCVIRPDVGVEVYESGNIIEFKAVLNQERMRCWW